MKLTVDVHIIDANYDMPKAVEIQWDGEAISWTRDDIALEPIATTPIYVAGEYIDPKKEPERFVENLFREYHGSAIQATEARRSP